MIPTVNSSDWLVSLLPNATIFPTFPDDNSDAASDELGALWIDLGGGD